MRAYPRLDKLQRRSSLPKASFALTSEFLVTIHAAVHLGPTALVFRGGRGTEAGRCASCLDFGGNTELLHLAESVTGAELWNAKEG